MKESIKNKEASQALYLRIAGEVTAARLRLGLSLNQLATSVGEQYTTIKRIEDGEPFSFNHILWIQNFLGINVYNVVKGEIYEQEDKKPEQSGFGNLF